MANHEDLSGERQENAQKTDEALAHLPKFPRLKWLGIAETQASDEGLEFVGRLPELETLIIWDAEAITGTRSRGTCDPLQLKFFHLNGSSITDEAVAHLSRGVFNRDTLPPLMVMHSPTSRWNSPAGSRGCAT